MYQLFYYPGNASMAPHLILEDLGLPFELHLVDRSVNAHQEPEYLKINPAGRIPALIDGETVLFETAAVCLHILDAHPQNGLIPDIGTPGRSHFYKWLMFLSNTIQSETLMYYYSHRYTIDADGAPNIRAGVEKRLISHFRMIDEQIGDGPYMLGDDFSAVDYYLLMVCRWARPYSEGFRDFSNLRRLLEKTFSRPAVSRVMKSEGIEAPFY